MAISRSRSIDAVRAVLEQAVRAGELSRSDAEWSITRLSEGQRPTAGRTDGATRRDEIVRAAVTIFRRDGFHRSKLEDVALQVGVTKATLYHYFASKQDVLEAICDRAMSDAEAAVERGVAASEVPTEQLRAVFTEYAGTLIGQGAPSVLFRNFEDLRPDAQQRLEKRRRRLEWRVVDVIEKGIGTGELRSADASIAALTAFGAVNWLHVWYSPEGARSADEIAVLLADQVMNGLVAR